MRGSDEIRKPKGIIYYLLNITLHHILQAYFMQSDSVGDWFKHGFKLENKIVSPKQWVKKITLHNAR